MFKKLKVLIWNLKHLDDLWDMYFDFEESHSIRDDLTSRQLEHLENSVMNLEERLDSLEKYQDKLWEATSHPEQSESLEDRYNELVLKYAKLANRLDAVESQLARLKAKQ